MKFGLLAVMAVLPVAAGGWTEAERAALGRISPDSLRGHLSFIASDLLEGRDTPSRGLDVAAEYIAAQFRRAGLRPLADGTYFQLAPWSVAEVDYEGFQLRVEEGDKKLEFDKDNVRAVTSEALHVEDAAIVKLDLTESAKWTSEQVAGKVVVLTGGRGFHEMAAARGLLAKLKPRLVLTLTGGGSGKLRNPDEPPAYPTFSLADGRFRKMVDGWKDGPTAARISVTLKAPKQQPVMLKNVIGVLPGSDPALKDTYVMLTAHYDHIGRTEGEGDVINNGANDDGSGTVSVIEIAASLAKMPVAPRRTIVFVTYFGEEKGLFGSRWYGRHPVFPVARTVADLNLEQLGRTDAPGGSTVGKASVTGFDFSDVGQVLHNVGAEFGFHIDDDPGNEAFFARSDNQALADLGVPSHTIAAAYEFPDYHKVGDEWQKIDYDNMAKLDRVITAAVLQIANSPKKPQWNVDSKSAEKYRKAAQGLHP
jgi:hypothetical protein